MVIAIEERVAVLEAQHKAQEAVMTQVTTTIRENELDVRESVQALEARMERRFDGVDRRFEAVQRQFEAVERRFDAMDRRFDTMDKRFQWLIAIQITTLLTALGAAFGVGR
jgi:phage shock protein A